MPSSFERVTTRTKPLSSEEWLALIEERCNALSPFLNSCTLTELFSVEFAQSDMGTSLTLREVDPEICLPLGGALTLKISGIWMSRRLQNEHLIVGYTRDHRWVLCKVLQNPRAHPRWFTIHEFRVSNPAELVSLYGVSYYQLWSMLGSLVSKWQDRALERARILGALADRFQREDKRIELIPER